MLREDYRRPSVTADVVVFTMREDGLCVLLVERRFPPFKGAWAVPGGFVEIDESLSRAAERELEEETGLRDVRLEQLQAFGDPGRDPRGRVITVAYLALVPYSAARPRAASDAARVAWWPVGNPPPLAFDHAEILACALERLRCEVRWGVFPTGLFSQSFTLGELRRAYEAILGEVLDGDVFRRKILDAGMLEESGEVRMEEAGEARLYRFRERDRAEARMSWLCACRTQRSSSS